jgi:branched-chain amino acid transport system substrate-binding protein
MTRIRRFRSFSLIAGTALVALACGGNSGGTSTGSTDTSKGEIKVAADYPSSGNDASDGIPETNGAAFAVTQTKAIKGFKLTFVPFDDTVNGVHDPQKGVQNITQMVSDPKILGMVGPNNSNVARAEIPVANQEHLAMISPANTNECLTQTFPYCDPQPSALRPAQPNNYFRIAASDTFQGPAMADFIVTTLGKKKVAIFSDNETFGKGVADNFAKELIKKGGSVAVRQDFDWKSTADFRPFLNQAKAAGAEAIYAGATSATKGCIPRAQMKAIFTTDIPFTGPDGIDNSQCITDSGDNAQNLYATSAGGNADTNPDAKATTDAYKAAYPKKTDLGAYTFASYDCMAILINAIGRAIDANGGKMPTRTQVVQAIAKTSNLKGLTGTVSFTAAGDPTAPIMSIYQTKGSPLDWVFIKQFAASGA